MSVVEPQDELISKIDVSIEDNTIVSNENENNKNQNNDNNDNEKNENIENIESNTNEESIIIKTITSGESVLVNAIMKIETESTTETNEYTKIFETISNRIKKATISQSTLNRLIIFVMEEMENSTIKGEQRKTLAIRIIRQLISDNEEINEETKNLCLQMIDNGLVESTIELIINATRGNLNINVVKNVSKGCLINCLTACLIKKTSE